MILQFFTADKASLRSCSQAAREFRHAALSRLGRHLTVNAAYHLKECALLVAGGAFQHICSLDLGINNGDTVLKADWKDYIVTLAAFSRYRTLNRLWLSEVPFNLLQSNQTGVLGEAIIALGSTVTELGLYRCCFSSYEEMVSLIRSFPLCDSLFVGDCITRGKPSVANAFAGLPEHKLSIKDLQLSSSFTSRGRLIDVSRLIGDAALDVGSLIALVCDVGTSERTQNIAAAVSASPVKQFQVACTEPGGYQGRHTARLRTTTNLTSSQSIHGSFVKLGFDVADHRAATPRDEHAVLGGSIQWPPSPSQRGRCHHRIYLSDS